MYALPVILFGAIDTEAVSIDDLKAWADQQILLAETPAPEWLIDLSFSSTLRQASQALRNEMRRRLVLPDGVSNLLTGLTYLRYRRGEISRERLVIQVGEILDAYDASLMDVESWEAQMAGASDIPVRVRPMLDKLAVQAEEALSRLLNTRTAGNEEFWSDRPEGNRSRSDGVGPADPDRS